MGVYKLMLGIASQTKLQLGFSKTQTQQAMLQGIKKLDVTFHIDYQDELPGLRHVVRDFVRCVAKLQQFSHLMFRIQAKQAEFTKADASPTKIQLSGKGADIQVSRQEF